MTSTERREIVVDGSKIAWVIEPTSENELCEAVADLNQSDEHALLAGSGSRLQFGNLGGPFQRVISTAKLNSIIEYSPDDLTIAVQVGVTLESIDQVLGASRQMLAIDNPCSIAATIGGSYATGLAGPSRLGSGSLKDAVIGVEAVLASGKHIKSGGMVVKNVTGYDMSGVFHGSLGAFGIITRLNLKVAPKPEIRRKYVFTFERLADAIAAGVRCLSSGLEISGIFAEGVLPGIHRLHLTLSGIEATVSRLGTRLSEFVYESGTPVDAKIEELSNRQDDSFGNFIDMNRHSSIARISCPASRQHMLLESVLRNDESGSWAYLADPGSGLIYMHADDPADLSLFSGIRDKLTWLALPPEQKTGLDVFGPMPERNFTIVSRLKHEFDPAGRLNRGRFVGGL